MAKDLLKEFDKHDWAHLHDLVLTHSGTKPTQEQLEELFKSLPEFLQEEAVDYGMNDTLWRDRVYDLLDDRKRQKGCPPCVNSNVCQALDRCMYSDPNRK